MTRPQTPTKLRLVLLISFGLMGLLVLNLSFPSQEPRYHTLVVEIGRQDENFSQESLSDVPPPALKISLEGQGAPTPKTNIFKPVPFPNKKLQNLTRFVNPYIGTKLNILENLQDNSGNVWVGANVPNGLLKVGIDSRWVQAGYSDSKPITGISFLHVSGTGGGDSYQVISMHPNSRKIVDSWRDVPENFDQSRFALNSDRADEKWKPGYFGVYLKETGCYVEFAATAHTSIHRYIVRELPASGEVSVIIDIGRNPGTVPPLILAADGFLGGEARIVNQGKEIHAIGTYQDFWASGFTMNGKVPYTVYFCAQLSLTPNEFGTWDPVGGIQQGNHFSKSTTIQPLLGAYATYNQTSKFLQIGNMLEIKTGVSYTSVEKACKYIEAELGDKDLEAVQQQAERLWNEKLNLISIEGAKDDNLTTIFYSSLMRSFYMPVNQTGENAKFQSTEPYYNDWYCIWDTFRTLHPLLTLIDPALQIEMLKSMLDIYRNEGWLFDSRVGGWNGLIQGGTNSDVLLSDAYVKKLPGINWKEAYAAVRKNAEIDPPDWLFEGRGDLYWWKTKGYIPAGVRSASRTMEYSYNDYCISLIADGLGKKKEAILYRNRSRNWINLWNSSLTSLETRGFIIPKTEDGMFVDGRWADPLACSPKGYSKADCHMTGSEFYEDSSWSYSLYAPHDMPKLVEMCGGKKKFVQRLDALFDNGLFYAGNEPSFLLPLLYNFVDEHPKTVLRVREALKLFTVEPDGIPGNDDGGAMASWFIFNAIGFFPVAGQDLYLLGVPSFEKVTLRVSETHFLVVRCVDFGLPTVDRVTLNGMPLPKPMFKHSQIKNGGELIFYMRRL